MRLEIDYNLLMWCIIGAFVLFGLAKMALHKKPYKPILALMVAFTMPAFIPGHGELVILVPSGALFGVSSTTAKVSAISFTVINFIISWFLLYKVCKIFNCKS